MSFLSLAGWSIHYRRSSGGRKGSLRRNSRESLELRAKSKGSDGFVPLRGSTLSQDRTTVTVMNSIRSITVLAGPKEEEERKLKTTSDNC